MEPIKELFLNPSACLGAVEIGAVLNPKAKLVAFEKQLRPSNSPSCNHRL